MGITRTLRVVSGAVLTGALLFSSAPNAAADQVRDDQWVLKSLDTESIWKTTKGKGQTVAVIDDGVNPNHPDLKGNVLKGKDFLDGGSAAPKPGDYHGTAMASLIAGHGHGPRNAQGVLGLAPESKILPIRDYGSGGKGDGASIRYAVDHGATVVNISQGGTSSSQEEAEAVAYALKKNVLVVAAPGNSAGPVEYPAAYPGAVAVTAVGESGTLWPKSSHGPKTMLSAPGAKIVHAGGPSNLNGYGIGSGTSDSAAYVSATAALLKAKYPDLSAGQIVNRLTKTAEMPASEKGAKLPDERYGYGSIRPLAALQNDIPKGSKYGPLSVPQQLKNEEKVAEKERESQAQQEQADREFVIIWSVIGVMALLLVVGIVLLVARSRRKKNRTNGPGGPGMPGGGYPYPPGPGYGQPPHQQQPYAPQPTAPPQQPPYN
ncbi:type VII secretion-associated serine protease mycosin [Streptomyces bathyalis]|uniref:Type VII secretion-associated serine protease mycosin n=1 Tax=Streptomyces bathyalis TaxID=2710756 RepID=A0A7T1T915_9ACTN|nr:type VII secretion-associated serine protease mycosin [Streptomyces bathyalis]QPP08617.1 type VII secretion-associated serine protease mycosin [Streptomyces bathyalis]